ncbi:MAG: hypothetical protein AUH85_10755 [Chloroflexi bacterium 13_1_40CM_4_68_4]|nr:MAG: hypothetical protein AUH85_10755 [Chloroflexi bacterium 13_1_40CM_4_68_4]
MFEYQLLLKVVFTGTLQVVLSAAQTSRPTTPGCQICVPLLKNTAENWPVPPASMFVNADSPLKLEL